MRSCSPGPFSSCPRALPRSLHNARRYVTHMKQAPALSAQASVATQAANSQTSRTDRRALLTMVAEALATRMAPLPAVKEATHAASLAAVLRRRLDQEHRQARHLRSQPMNRRGGGSSGSTSGNSGAQRRSDVAATTPPQESLSDFFAAHVAMPVKHARGYALSHALTGVYLATRYSQLDLLRGSSVAEIPLQLWLSQRTQAEASDATHVFEALWREEGLCRTLVTPSQQETDAALLLGRLTRHPRTTSASAAAVVEEVTALSEEVCVPFLYAFWGIEYDGDKKIHRPACDSSWFQRDLCERLQQPAPWAMVDKYAQLHRLSNVDGVQQALHASLIHSSGKAAAFEQKEPGAALRLSPRVVDELMAQLQPELHTPMAAPIHTVLPSSPPLPPPPSVPQRSPSYVHPPPLPPPSTASTSSVAHVAPPLPSFHALLAAAHASNRVDLAFHMAQAAVRAIFNALLPLVTASDGGWAIEPLEERVRWRARYAAILGTLSSFLIVFEDVFFTLRRHPCHADARSERDAVVSEGPGAGIRFVTAYTGPVGPWLLYGRVIGLFFPTDREVPLGVVAEALSWGLYFAPQFGDLPSLLAVVGREVHRTMLLPCADADSERNEEKVHSLIPREKELAGWLMVINAAYAAQPEPECKEQTTQTKIPLRDVLEVAQVMLGLSSTAATTALKEVVDAFPTLIRWDAPLPREGAEGTLEPQVLCVRTSVPPALHRLVASALETYVCPLLRSAIPHTLPALATEASLDALWRTRQHPLLKALHAARGNLAGQPCGPPTLCELLWLYTAGRAEQAPVVSPLTLWQTPGSASNARRTCTRHGARLSLVLHALPHMNKEGNAVYPVSAHVHVSGAYRSPKDHLLTVNGLRVASPSADPTGEGVGTEPELPRLVPSEKPVSLFEWIAETEALQAVATAEASTHDAIPCVEGPALEAAFYPFWPAAAAEGILNDSSGDVVVWADWRKN